MFIELSMVALLLLLLYLWNKDPPGLPPGPKSFIGLGSFVPQTTDHNRELRNKYGDIVRVCAGQQNIVGLYNYKTLREVFSKAEFSDRPNWKAAHFLSDGEEAGVIFSNGEKWLHSRKFFLRQLKDMGMGKSYLDDAILEEAKELVDDFRNHTDKPIHLPSSINVVTLNVIWQLVASRRYGLHDEYILNFMALLKKFQEDMSCMIFPEFFPWLKYLPQPLFNKLFKFDRLQKTAIAAKDLMMEVVEEHKAKLDSSNPRDVIDHYLLEIDAHKEELQNLFTEDDMIRGIFDLFSAGFDTTSNMIRWMCLYMADNQEVQKKIQREIDEVVDRGTLPSHLHRSRLTYLDATLNEVQRTASLVSTGIPHVANCDMRIEDYNIPKGTLINGCASVIHSDSRYWDQPEEFRPERFLDESGNLAPKREGFLPFGVGKRSCLGEALARTELYIFSAALLQNFSFAPPEGSKVDLGCQSIVGAQFPKGQDLIITARK